MSQIDRVVHEPVRLRILSSLFVVESAEFLFFVRQLNVTQGNLSSHMSKRGCSSEASGRPIVDRAIFAKATQIVLLDDYRHGLEALRARREIDPARIVL